MPCQRPRRAAAVLLLGLTAGGMVRGVPSSLASDTFSAGDFDDWETARSQHFVVHTDAGLGAIQAIIARFEDTYEALRATFFRQVEVPAVEVLVFGDEAEYRAVAGGTAGKFLTGVGSTGSLLLVRHAESPEALDTVVAHELAHRFAEAAHPGLPGWLDEGIASYLESVEVREDQVRFGAAARRRAIHGMAVAGGVSFEALIGATPDRLYGNEASFYYAAAWALVHHLMNGRGGALRPRFPQLLVAVAAATRQRQSAARAFAEVYPDVTLAELNEAIERLTRGLNRPATDVLVVIPFQRPPVGRIDRAPADRQQLQALVEAVQRTFPNRPDPVVDLGARPRLVRLDVQPSFETPFVGLAYGMVFHAPLAWELGLGLGPLGYEAGALGRAHLNVGEGGNFFVSAGFGPVLALKSEWLGNEIRRHEAVTDRPRRLYYFVGLVPELAAEVRTPSNLVARVSVGAYLGLAENLTELCARALPGSGEPRCPEGAADARIARSGRALFARVGLGYSW
jgi:hypothetical protein